jgi:3-oxoacyl-[acyl-carrier-protein] synthase III
VNILGVGVLTGWGRGVQALPEDARAAATGRYVIAIPRPERAGDRARRATRECLLGIAAVEELLGRLGIPPSTLSGPETALLYATASAYGASNRSFIEAGGTLHFPYTAPSAVPAEVAIEYGLRGTYLNFIGGAATTLDALWYAGNLLERGECNQALVLAVEVFEECADLYRRARWLARGPLVEAAACALLVPGGRRWVYADAPVGGEGVRRRAGETFACEPLIALALDPAHDGAVTATWRGRRAGLRRI